MKKSLAFITSLALMGTMSAVSMMQANASTINLTKIFKEDFINNSIGHPDTLPELSQDEFAELQADEDGFTEQVTVDENGSVTVVTASLLDGTDGYIAQKTASVTDASGIMTEYAIVNFDSACTGYTDMFYILTDDNTRMSSADYTYKYVAEDDAVVLTDIEAVVNSVSVSAPAKNETFSSEANIAVGDMVKAAEVHMTAFDENNEPVALVSEIDDVLANKISTQDVVIDYASVEIDIFAMDVTFDGQFLNSRDYRYFPTATDRSKMMLYNGKGSATEDGLIQVEAFTYDETLTQKGHYLVLFDTLENMRNSNQYTENYISRTAFEDSIEEEEPTETEPVTEAELETETEPETEPETQVSEPNQDCWKWYYWQYPCWNWNPWSYYGWNHYGWNSWGWGCPYYTIWWY